LARFLSGAVKTYWAVVRFGFATDTYDSTGRPIGSIAEVRPKPEILKRVLTSFLGKQEQVPPPFAAKKVKGQRMYRLARAGVKVEPKPVTVVIRRITLLELKGDRATIDVEVESGTYIRSLAHDLGDRLGCGAHLEELRRVRVGALHVDQAHTLGMLESLRVAGCLEKAVVAPSEALLQLPALELSVRGAQRAGRGMGVSAEDVVGGLGGLRPNEHTRLLGQDRSLVAVGAVGEGRTFIRPVVVLQASGPKKDKEATTTVASDFTG
jgi:tRNA pseudouridine55 synthase